MEFTGERFLPDMDIDSEIAIFHYQRYQSILQICRNKAVLDIACGEGYGSNLLAEVALSVYGVDIDAETITEAAKKYKKENLKYMQGTVAELEFQDDMFDVVVSFETIEHVQAKEQTRFVKEIRRVLKKGGLLVMSSPDKHNYSEVPAFVNPFHIHELYRNEFETLLKTEFLYMDFYYQGRMCNAYIFDPNKSVADIHHNIELRNADQTQAEYIVALCSDREIEESIVCVVCDANNQYYKMNREIGKLHKEVEYQQGIIQQKENYILEQRAVIRDCENQMREQHAIIEQKENYICEQRELLLQRENELRGQQGTIEQKENYICEQRQMLTKQGDELRVQQGYIDRQEEDLVRQKKKIRQFETFVETRGIRQLYHLYLKKSGET